MVQIQKKQYNFNKMLKLILILLMFECSTTLLVCGEGVGSIPVVPNGVTAIQSNPVFSTTPDNNYDDYYYNYQYDSLEMFKLDSDYCRDKSICSDYFGTFPDKLCHCDKLCGLFNDCCSNYESTLSLMLTKEQFECVSSYEIVKNRDYGVNMVTKCLSGWEHNVTKSLCENKQYPDDTLLRLPVSDKSDLGVMFRNMYCAQCNNVDDFEYWKPEIKCINETGVRSIPGAEYCNLSFIRPRPAVTYRVCQVSPSIISTCPNSENKFSDELVLNCTNGVYSIVYDANGTMFRNKYCVKCSGDQVPMFCENIDTSFKGLYSGSEDPARRITYSLKRLVDLNTDTETSNGIERKLKKCNNNEIYDSYSDICREIFCAPPLIPTSGRCKSTPHGLNMSALNDKYIPSSLYFENCTLTKLDPSEFEFTNNSEVFIFSQNKVYSKDNFTVNGSDVFICLDKIQECSTDCKASAVKLQADVIESYVSLVGLVVSISCLAVTLIVYLAFPQLLNTPGKILVSLIISLLLAQLLFLTASKAESVPKLCFVFGVLIHYFFLSAFCWMNVIAVDLWMTFSNRFITPGSDSKGTKRFILYSLYAWLVPVTIVIIAVIIDFVKFDKQNKDVQPGYGNGICWISSKKALLLFFLGPLALLKLVDIVSFIFTAVHIARASRQARMATQKTNTCSFIINIKLSLIMGLTWVLAFLANVTNVMAVWYLFIIFNSLQGLFIAICFLCTKKVGRLMSDKYKHVTTRYTTGTQMTSMT